MTAQSPTAAVSEGVPSPCIGICKLDAANVCIGCRRTLAEIAEWSQAANERRQEILRNVESRR